jgi:hypothetical protein
LGDLGNKGKAVAKKYAKAEQVNTEGKRKKSQPTKETKRH